MMLTLRKSNIYSNKFRCIFLAFYHPIWDEWNAITLNLLPLLIQSRMFNNSFLMWMFLAERRPKAPKKKKQKAFVAEDRVI